MIKSSLNFYCFRIFIIDKYTEIDWQNQFKISIFFNLNFVSFLSILIKNQTKFNKFNKLEVKCH